MMVFPVGDQVLVELDQREQTFGDSTIERPQTVEEKPIWGTVRGVGPGRTVTRRGRSRYLPTTVAKGQRVMIAWGTGHDLTIAGRHHVCIHEHGPDGDGEGGILAVEDQT